MTTLFKFLISAAVCAYSTQVLHAEDTKLPYWKDIQTVAVNKEYPRTAFMTYDNRNQALTGEYENSPYYKLLNGTWNFYYADAYKDLPANIEQPDANIAWKEIKVPGNWEVQGYGVAIYTNHGYEFKPRNPQPPQLPETNPVGVYQRDIEIPADWDGRDIFLRLEGAKSGVYVYVNGQEVGYSEDSKNPQDTIRNPRTMYGVTKVSGELLSDYYHIRFGVDTRSVRFPGLISYVTPPGGGTTDYAVDIYYSAVKGEKFECPIAAGTFMDMMYMPDGLRAAIEIMEANPDKLIHRNSFNIASMSFDPEIICNNIKKYMPDFHMEYKVDPLRQAIAESWPNSLDDTCAREEWGWKPEYDLDSMTQDMLAKLKIR